ncbi:MAG TPA: MBL fold metallo-hydrolase [Xanthomonadales bacterium]|nr:MBL fold metallo-hydrolase [Xanthomonadales bacterium]
MQVTIHGAAGEVTGSCSLIAHRGARVLLDCGIVQGDREAGERNRAAFPFDPGTLDAVVLTHAHLDHIGRVPLLVKRGYAGPIYTHRASVDLAKVLLEDAAHIASSDTEQANRRRERRGMALVQPLYDMEDVANAMRLFVPLEYHVEREVAPGIVLKLHDAGHILGSGIAELRAGSGADARTLVHSGDLGMASIPILRDPERVAAADLVMLESTYGDRLHRARPETVAEIGRILDEARGTGSVLIPAFAVGRSQEILYWLAENAERWNLRDWQVVLDSPMAQRVFEVYDRHQSLFDKEGRERWRANHPLRLPNLKLVRDRAESQALNPREGLIIIAGAGMCNGGRIVHHLKHRLWKAHTHVMIVGYQAQGTLGRRLVDGAGYVRILGDEVRVAAKIHTIGGLSAHADQDGLLEWYGGFRGAPRLALVHGEERARIGLAGAMLARYRVEAMLPRPGDEIAV